MSIIAIDLLSTSFTLAVFGKSGRIFEKQKFDITSLNGPQVSHFIQKQINATVKKFKGQPLQIKSVGIGVPGIYYSKTGTVWAPNIPGWESYPLKKDLNYLLIDENIKTKIASKRTCDILGEKWQGAAKNTRNAIFLSVGNGIGAGVLIDGRTLYGHNDIVGAAGWLTSSTHYKDEFKGTGFLESLASWKGILKKIIDYTKTKNYKGKLKNIPAQKLTINDLIIAYEENDPAAKKIINESIKLWGTAAANLISLFNPEVLIFGGALFGPTLKFLDKIKAEAEKWAQPISMVGVKFCGSKLGEDAGLYGAGFLALKKF
ncbi:ROK family protein [Melioribacteraceae bacterium 4301-Me]|uniref:ROK family protein n=1 Tax=Pyranulibacter aquaticus TaxID=3163344 RepID=UPI0035968110